MTINYDKSKNLLVIERCGVGFEDAIDAIGLDGLLDIVNHPNVRKYAHQRVLVLKIKKYVYAVPYVYNKGKDEAFLKTMYPSRKLTKDYL